MPTVGEQLRTARETQKLAIHQVADWTKIRSDHIRALEEGNYSVFSAPVYIRGFVRTYATLLKLDATAVLSQLTTELADSGQTEPTFNQPAGGIVDDAMFQFSKFFRRLALPVVGVVLLLVLLVVSYLLWQHAQNQDPLEGLGPAMYHPAPSAEKLPLPKSNS